MVQPVILLAGFESAERAALSKMLEADFSIEETQDIFAMRYVLLKRRDITVVLISASSKGNDAAKAVKDISSDAQFKGISIVAVTSPEDEALLSELLECGARDFIARPLRADVVCHRIKNISHQQSVSEAMDATSLQLHTLLNSLPGGVSIFEVGPSSIENVYVNESLRKFTGYSKEEFEKLFSKNFSAIIAAADYPPLLKSLHRSIENSEPSNVSFRIITKSGEPFWVNMRSTKIGVQGANHLFYSILLDINAEKALEEKNQKFTQELSYQARHDQLTGIYNRRAFCESTASLLRGNPNVKYVVVCTDIYRFKVINELFSVETGNLIIKTVAQHFYKMLEGVGTYCRFEADLFAICLPQKLFDPEKLISGIQASLSTLGINYDIPLYAGIYPVDNIELEIDIMCDRASLALHTIKGSYIKHWAFYDSRLRESIVEEQKIIRNMSSALKNGEFCFYLQPICDMMTDRPIGAEALVRWNHPTRGLMQPSEFLPLFERNGFITQLDAFVLEQVAAYINRRQSAGLPVVPISTNLSRVNMHNPHLCDEILKIIGKYNISPSMLQFEITEGAYNDNPRQLIETMKALQARGFRMMMDDFGSGYSSLNMLKDVPVNALKIDMRFIDDLETSNRAGNVVTSVVRMAKWLNMVVVAEGAENRAQVDFLRSIGCDCAQGYYYANPMPLPEFERYLAVGGALSKSAEMVSTLENFNLDALLNSSREINLLFNSVIGALGIYELCDGCLEVVRVNDGYYEMTGDTPQTLSSGSKNILLQIFAGDREPLINACHTAERTGKVQQLLIRRHCAASKLIWLDIKIRYIGQNKGRSIFYFASNNVTKQKENEQKEYLVKYTAALRSVYCEILELNFAADTIRVLYLSDEMKSVIPGFCRLRSTVENTLEGLFHPDDKAIFKRTMDAAIIRSEIEASKKNCYTIEARRRRDDGNYHWISQTMIQIPTDSSDVYLCCVADIDSRKEAEAAIAENRLLQQQQQAQQRYRIIIEQTGAVVFEWDIMSERFFAGDGLEQFSMYGTPGMHAKNCDYTSVCHPDDVAALNDLKRRLYSGEHHADADIRFKKLDGSYPWCRVSVTVIYSDMGIPERALGTITDIDASKKADLQLLSTTSQLKETTKELNHLLDNLPVGVGIYELGFPISRRYINEYARDMFGMTDSDTQSLSVIESFANTDRATLTDALAEIENGRSYYDVVYHSKQRGGGEFWVRCFAHILTNEGSVPVCYVVMADVTEQMQMQQSYNQQHELYQMLLEESQMVIFDYDSKIDVMTVSVKKADGQRIEYKKEHYLSNIHSGTGNGTDMHPDSLETWLHMLSDTDEVLQSGVETEVRADLAGLGYKWYRVTCAKADDGAGNTRHIFGMGRDIQYEKDVQSERSVLQRKAETDFLSGLYNRAAVEERARAALLENKDGAFGCAFMLFDIDNFKSVNDTYGHIEGDRLIHRIGEIFKGTFRSGDIIGRIGGDEFAVLMCNVKSSDAVERKAAATLAAVLQISEEFGWQRPVSASIGIAHLDAGDETDFRTLYQKADQALYEAKESGKNRYVIK